MLDESRLSSLLTVDACITDQARPAVAQEELSSIGLGFGQKRQKNVAHFRSNPFFLQNFKRLSQVKHFRNRRWLFQTPAAQRFCQASHLEVELGASPGRSQFNDSGFSFRARMLDAQIKGSPAERVTEPSFLVRSEHHERNRPGSDEAQFWNTELPHT